MTDTETYIAKIVNDTTFIITAGVNKKVQVNDQYRIVGENSTEIINPVTNERLGSFSPSKGTIIVSEVFDNFSLCKSETIEKEIENPPSAISSAYSAIRSFQTSKETVIVHKHLNVDDDQITGGLVTEPIKVGDLVEKISTF